MLSVKRIFCSILCLLSCLPLAQAAKENPVLSENSEQASFKLITIAEGFDFPWDMLFLPDGDILVAEYDGRIQRVLKGSQKVTLAGKVQDVTEKGGLRGISLHPEFDKYPYVYFCHASGTADKNNTKISRGRWRDNKIVELSSIFSAENEAKQLAHYGCRLSWLKDGTLVATFGDRRHHAEEAQNLNNHYGVAVRINADGSIPLDNPFIATPGTKGDVWAYGIRNAQGATFHPTTGDLWISEHGPLGGDEINILTPGKNYGWPIATFGIDYDGKTLTDTAIRPDVESPIYYWYPSIAPSSIAFYTGSHFPKWKGDLFMTTLASQQLLRLEIHENRVLRQEALLDELNIRLRNVEMGADGFMYILTDAGDGRLLRVEPLR